ncbi:MAG: single-stranded-DNA-specific exonuclease RecJ [Planctomycetota bacterium]
MSQWSFYPTREDLAERLSQSLEISPLLGQLLVNRGVQDPAEARRFISPELKDLHDPFLFKDMDLAAERVKAAIARGERILVFGDYDVDGVSGTALLLQFLRFTRAKADFLIPNRLTDGYGLSPDAVRKIRERNAQLVITVDNGVSAVEEIRELKRLGIDTVVCDHHQVGSELPPAVAVLNHQRTDCEYPNKHLCGVGVAFKLCWAVAQRLSDHSRVKPEFRDFLLDAMAWVCLGTITDVVELQGENRILAKYGLWAIQNSKSPGLKALLEVSGVKDRAVRSDDIGFRLGPRLNAAGRLGQAEKAIRLLSTSCPEEAKQLAGELEEANLSRREIERAILEHARERVLSDPNHTRKGIFVLADDEWHLGVVGIVAARLVDEFHRPTVLIAMDGETGRGSGRSIPGFDLHAALCDAGEHMISFGGHPAAAGVHVARQSLEQLTRRLEEVAEERMKTASGPSLQIDAEVRLPFVDDRLVRDIDRMNPFGMGNPRPVFASTRLKLAGQPRLVGRDSSHLMFLVNQGPVTIKAIGFGMGEHCEKLQSNGDSFSMAYTPVINEWRNRRTVELEVKDLRFD